MQINKKNNRKYLGFNDFWFSVIGILILSFSVVYIFNSPLDHLSAVELGITWVIALFFSICDWFINRAILIRLRKKYPKLKNSTQRIVFLFLATSTTIIIVDFIGVYLFSFIWDNVSYNFSERTRSLIFIILITIMIMAIYEAIYFFVLLKKSIKEEGQTKQAIIQAELDALRNRAQPHFFFNTLNTLRDIIDQNSKEDAKQFVDKLSEIYRFLLESSNVNLTSLRKELKFSKAYIHVQKERFGDNLKLNWNIPESFLDNMIAPMGLQLLLENAIKHNVISKSKPLEINISIKDDYIIVYNRIQKKSTQLPSTKIGLKNIEKRYELISKKSVKILNDGHQFSVSLPLLKTP